MTDQINDGGPAFPRPCAETSQGGNYDQDGMSLRDYFAGQVVQGWLATFTAVQPMPKGVAMFAYSVADEMLAERARATGAAS